MKILVFTEGTILTNKNSQGLTRQEIVERQRRWSNLPPEELEKLKERGEAPSPKYFANSIPIGDSPEKIAAWERQSAHIVYLTSRTTPEEVRIIREVLRKHFPEGELFFRKPGEEYKDVAERILPDIIVEDDCESIGGEAEMTYPRIRPDIKKNIKSIVVKEGGGIDHLPDNLSELLKHK